MKKIFYIIILFLLSINIVKAVELPVDVTADAVVLMNLDTEQIIYTKNPDKKEILASLTKVMTAYVVIQNVEDLNKKVTITEEDIYGLWGFTCVGLEVGDKVSYMDLLYGAILTSGADATQALAYHTAGSPEAFVKLMNEEAKKLGLNHTNFEDSYGGHDDNVSTAREFTKLLKECLKNETFKKVFNTYQKKLSNDLVAFNSTRGYAFFHGLDENLIIGSKSGYTPEAGLLLASTANINGTNYALVIMKCEINDYMSTHVLESYRIYDYVSTLKFETKTVIKKNTVLKTIPVENGTISEYAVVVDRDINITLTEDELQAITTDIHIASKITPNNKKGDNLGFVDILLGNEVIATYDIYLTDDIYTYKEEERIPIIVTIILLFLVFIILIVNIFTRKPKKSK